MPSRVRKPAAKKKAQPQDAVSMLKKDHELVQKLLTQLDNTRESAVDRRKALLQKIEQELKIHTDIEEQIFYPAYKEAVSSSDEHIYYEAVEEHGVVDWVLPQLRSTAMDTVEFSAKAKVLKDLIEHHVEEEETEMFPKARKALGTPRLRELGELMKMRKQEISATMLTRLATTAGRTLGKVMGKTRRAA